MVLQNRAHITLPPHSKWSGPGLNRRHMDFQSIALPTELPDLSCFCVLTCGVFLSSSGNSLTPVCLFDVSNHTHWLVPLRVCHITIGKSLSSTMGKSSMQRPKRKPLKDFPLTLRKSDGRWQKKIKGKVHYFVWTREEVLDEWLRVKDDLLAGREPREKDGELAIGEACDEFLVAKRQQVDAGELKVVSWLDYKRVCDRLVEQFGKARPVLDLRAEDFEKLKATIAKRWGVTAVGNEVNRTRVVFKYFFDAGLIDRPVRFGPLFKRTTKKVLRIHKAKHVAEHGKNLLSAADIRDLLGKASPAMKAMILLAINSGMGNSDVGHLPQSAIKQGWLDFPRPKTGVARRCPIWAEILAAIDDYLLNRPSPKLPGVEKLVFVTRCGDAWAKDDRADNPITKEFRKLLNDLDLHRPRIGFYTLRHVHRTIAGGVKDPEAANVLMGHADGSMAERRSATIDCELLPITCGAGCSRSRRTPSR